MFNEEELYTLRYVARMLMRLEDGVNLGVTLRRAIRQEDFEVIEQVRDKLMYRLPTTQILGETMSIPIGAAFKKNKPYTFTITTYTLGLMVGGCLLEFEEVS